MKDRWIKNKSTFMYKIRNNLLPEGITNMFNVSNNVRYNLRSDDRDYLLQKPQVDTLLLLLLNELIYRIRTSTLKIICYQCVY